MARPRKDGRRAEGIQGKHGSLFVVVSKKVIKDGKTKYERVWIPTGLDDTPNNIKKAQDVRQRLIHKHGSITIDRNITMPDYTDAFLEKKRREVSDSTYSGYYYRGKCIKEYFENVKLKDVDSSLVECFLDYLFENKKMQPRTVKDIKAFLVCMIDQAVRDTLIAYNPAKEAVISKQLAADYTREKNTDDEFFSFNEAQLFINEAQTHELFELFYFTLLLGLRREEVLGLRWSAVDPQFSEIRINHTVTKGLSINRTNTTKTVSSDRTYVLDDVLKEMLHKLKKREEKNRKLCGKSYFENDYIFKHEDGTLYYPDYPTKAFKKLLKKNPELPQGVTFHGLRSSCVSILVNKGLNVKEIQKYVGHADVDTTLRIYAKVKDKESKKKMLKNMSTLYSIEEYRALNKEKN